MNIQDLRYFVEISKNENLTKAAQSLFISQPALSKAIKRLEDHLKVKLFNRKKNGMVLTDSGLELLAKTKPVLLELDNIVYSISDIKNLKKGKITLGIPMLINFLYFCDIILNFKKEYPGIDMDIIEIGDDSIGEKVSQGKIDIGVVTKPVNSLDLNSISIYTDEIIAFIPKTNPLSRLKSIKFSDLHKQPLHMFSSDFSLYGQVVAGCQNAGFNPIISCTSSQRYFLVDMAISTNGVVIMPKPIIQGMQNDITDLPFREMNLAPRSSVENLYYPDMCMLPFKPIFPWTISLILKKSKYSTYAMKAMIQYIKDYFTEDN